ncbi:hemicentin-1-like isoform X2 [Phymastichus coffea]|nr:hemicentin-1-like isoform X2 [Phymastichus coffea]XP_058796761.1 hemicentin-1-like isoform X2 [Phymastichus coffea]
MLFWYRSENDGSPIYSVDARSSPLNRGRQWSNPNVLADRATVTFVNRRAELRIDKLMPEDAGLYKCRLDYRNNPTRNRHVNLTVVVPPQSPVIYTSGRTLAHSVQPFNEDSELVLICEVQGGSPPPKVTWYRDGKLTDDTYKREYDEIAVNRLDVHRVTRDLLSAQYVCQASNTDLIEPVSTDIMLNVNLKPLVVNITNKTPYLSALGTYEIECVSSGSRPHAVITWWKGTHQVKHMARTFAEGQNMTRSIMSYVPTMEDDNKFLTCRAENPVVHDSALEDRWHLVIHYAPLVTIKLGSTLRATTINEGDDVYFECEVISNPKAYKLVWYKNGREIHHNPMANVKIPGGNSLVLQKVTRNSSGDYACAAANDEGKAISAPVELDVQYAPVCKDGTTTQVVGALKHETISLVCGVQAKPAPTSFQWTFNNSGELMNMPTSKFAQVKPQHLVTSHWHGSRLNYTPASDMDYGTIACYAINSIGTQKVPCFFQIIVAGKPYPLQNCSAVQSTGSYAYRMSQEDFKTTDARDVDWLIVRCSEGFDGGLPITSFELEVYSDENVYHVNTIYINHTDKVSTNTLGPMFEVPGLEPGRNYKMLLYAVNAKGRSDPVVLEPVTLKGVAMYTTGLDSSNYATDYSLLVACFAGGITAICILVVGVTLTLHRRNQPLQSTKTQTRVVHYTAAVGAASGNDTLDATAVHDDRLRAASLQQQLQIGQHKIRQEYELQQQPCRMDISSGRQFEMFAQTSTSSSITAGLASSMMPEENPDVIASRTSARQNGFLPGCQLLVEGCSGSPGVRPSTLPVHGTHDVYTKSLRLQESCI